MTTLNRQTIERLVQYYNCIEDEFGSTENANISSTKLAKQLGLDDTQVRKDLAAIGVKGLCRVGFDKDEVLRIIQATLGFTETYQAIVVGAGRLGGAIALYAGFEKYGLNIVALFDTDKAKLGFMLGEHIVQPLEQIETIVEQRKIVLAILTVPAQVAQKTADRLVAANIKAIWNFSSINLVVPAGTIVRNEYLSMGLAHMAYQLKQQPKSI